MTTVLLSLALGLDIVAVAWALLLGMRHRDWRLGILPILFGFATVHDWRHVRLGIPGSAGADLAEVAASLGSLFLLAVVQHILTAKRRQRHALQQTRTQYEHVVEDAPWGIALHDGQHLLYANPQVRSMFGYAPEADLVGVPLTQFAYPPDWTQHLAPRLRQLQAARVDVLPLVEWQGRRCDGSLFWVQSSAARTTWQGQPALVTFLLDISTRKAAESAMALLAPFPAESPHPVLRLASDGTVLYHNAAAGAVLPFLRPVPVVLDHALHTALRTQTAVDIEYQHEERVWQLSLVPLPQGYANMYAYEMTALRQREAQLVSARKLEILGHMAGGVAHDFNNLLTVLVTCTESLQSLVTNGALVTRYFALLTHSITQATEMVQRLLAFSRRQALYPQLFRLADLVLETRTVLGVFLPDNIDLEVAVSDDECCVEVDRAQLEQVLVNLVINARDAMPDGGTVRVTTHAIATPAPAVQITVGDTGSGMDDATLARLFEPFFTTKPHGTGLGLSMAYGFVHQSGGRLEVESRLGHGTTFTVILPVVSGTPVALEAPASSSPDLLTAPPGTVVLVIEDNDIVQTLVVEVLRGAGYEVVGALSGETAIELMGHMDTLHLVLTDLHVPGRPIMACLEDLQARYPGLRVGYMSGSPQSPGRTVAQPFLAKPFTVTRLLRFVAEVLGREG
jgi:PAS domain S-box-containing protein